VYLTGAIAPDDRTAVIRHLAACADCRAELAGLAALPALLRRAPVRAAAQTLSQDDAGAGDTGRADEAAAGSGAPGDAVPRRLGRRLMRRRRRRRWLLATAVLVIAAAAAAGWALHLTGPPASRPETAATVLEARTIGGVTVLTDARGAGVTGAIGAIARPDGSLQATYDGHPLYTTSADTGPGQARGNGVWSHGGEWHEVTVTAPDQRD